MKVKISVKKLHRIEQMYEQRIEEAQRLYCREADAMKKETEYYKESAKGEHEYYKDMVAEVLELREQYKEANAENERLKNLIEEKVQSHLQQLAEINELKEQIQKFV